MIGILFLLAGIAAAILSRAQVNDQAPSAPVLPVTSIAVGNAIGLTTANLANPTELNSIGTVAGDFRMVTTSGGSPDSVTLYRLDSTSAAVFAPFVMASATAGLRWIAVAGYAQAGSAYLYASGVATMQVTSTGNTAQLVINGASGYQGQIVFQLNGSTIASIASSAGNPFAFYDAVNSTYPMVYQPGSLSAGQVQFRNTTACTSTSSGCIVASGGIGCAGAIIAAGNIISFGVVNSNAGSINSISTTGNSSFSMSCPSTYGNFIYSTVNSVAVAQIASTASNPFYIHDLVNNYNPIQYNAGSSSAGTVVFSATTPSSGTSTGAVIVAGGLGVGGGINCGGIVNASICHSVGGTQVLAGRVSGYGTPTGGARQPSFAAGSITLANLAACVAQLILDLEGHGMIGT